MLHLWLTTWMMGGGIVALGEAGKQTTGNERGGRGVKHGRSAEAVGGMGGTGMTAYDWNGRLIPTPALKTQILSFERTCFLGDTLAPGRYAAPRLGLLMGIQPVMDFHIGFGLIIAIALLQRAG